LLSEHESPDSRNRREKALKKLEKKKTSFGRDTFMFFPWKNKKVHYDDE